MLTPLGTVPDTETVIEFTREEDNSSRTGEQSRKSTSQGESGGSAARGRHTRNHSRIIAISGKERQEEAKARYEGGKRQQWRERERERERESSDDTRACRERGQRRQRYIHRPAIALMADAKDENDDNDTRGEKQ